MSSRLLRFLIGSHFPAAAPDWLLQPHRIPSSTFVNFLRSGWKRLVVVSPGARERGRALPTHRRSFGNTSELVRPLWERISYATGAPILKPEWEASRGLNARRCRTEPHHLVAKSGKAVTPRAGELFGRIGNDINTMLLYPRGPSETFPQLL